MRDGSTRGGAHGSTGVTRCGGTIRGGNEGGGGGGGRGKVGLRGVSRGMRSRRGIAHATAFLGIRPVLPIFGSLDAGESVLCGVHSASHGLQGAKDIVGLPSSGTIVAGNGSWKRPELIDGEDKDEVSKKGIRKGVVGLSVHVDVGEGRRRQRQRRRGRRRGSRGRPSTWESSPPTPPTP